MVSVQVRQEHRGSGEGVRAKVTAQKHKRSNHEQRNDARRMVRLWYHFMAKEGRVQYLSNGQRRAILIPDVIGDDVMAATRKARPENWTMRGRVDRATRTRIFEVEAHGVERRYIFPQGFDYPRGFGTIADRAPDRISDYLDRINDAMLHVAAMCFEARQTLEMEAATWPYPEIAAELGCGEQTARQFFEAGLAHLMSYRHLVKAAPLTE
jgi:hypothetical protein